ncbi:hypothetical protein BDZ45DRAFT_782107, partial [Acephala macrosclerotiorum]
MLISKNVNKGVRNGKERGTVIILLHLDLGANPLPNLELFSLPNPCLVLRSPTRALGMTLNTKAHIAFPLEVRISEVRLLLKLTRLREVVLSCSGMPATSSKEMPDIRRSNLRYRCIWLIDTFTHRNKNLTGFGKESKPVETSLLHLFSAAGSNQSFGILSDSTIGNWTPMQHWLGYRRRASVGCELWMSAEFDWLRIGARLNSLNW